MRATDLIAHLNAQGIFPYVDHGKLKTRSDSADIAAATVTLIRENKEELLRFLAADIDGVTTAQAAITPRADRSAAAPLSFAQQRLWFLDQLDRAASVAYHVPTALRLNGMLDRAALTATLDRVPARGSRPREDDSPRSSCRIGALRRRWIALAPPETHLAETTGAVPARDPRPPRTPGSPSRPRSPIGGEGSCCFRSAKPP
jgi:hypothetical protein